LRESSKKLGFGDADNIKKVDEAKRAQKEANEKRIAAGGHHWVEVYDPASDAFYYYNNDTGDQSWEKPEHYIMAADDFMMSAVIKIQCAYRTKVAMGKI